MNITVNKFNKHQKGIFVAINIFLITVSICLFVSYEIISGLENNKFSVLFALLFILFVFVFFVTNILKSIIEKVTRKHIETNIAHYLEENKLDDLYNYLVNISNKKNFSNNVRVILYYIAYYHLLINDIAAAKGYFSEIKYPYISFDNVYYYEAIIFLSFLDFYKENDVKNIDSLYEKFLLEKEKILKFSKNNSDIIKDFTIIEKIKNNKFDEIKEILKETRFTRVPFVSNLTF